MAKILITGGTGSLGSALVKRYYHLHELTVLSRDPHKQAKMTAQYPNVRYILADICNTSEVWRACLGQDILIHACALKDVGTGEFHPSEFVRVNVLGSQVVAEAWSKAGNGPALLISTDKAAAPLNLYGATKKAAESLFRKYNYSAIRYGNVIESAGSFVHKWRETANKGQPISVRIAGNDDRFPTRFCLRMSEAIDLIEDALTLTTRGDGIFVPHGLRAFSVGEAAAATGLMVEYGPLLPYEKLHETLVAEGETAVQESPLLARIKPGWDNSHIEYRSSNAPRMSGGEVLEVMGW